MLLALLTVLPIASCTKKAQVASRPPRSVRAEAVVVEDFRVSEEYAARIAPGLEINLTPKVPGRVLSLGADVGAHVVKGQALLRLDAADYDAQYRQAKAALESAQASLARTSDSGQEQQMLQAQSALDQANVAYDDARSMYEKTKRLFESGAISKQRLDDMESQFKSTGIQRDAAAQALAIVKDKAGFQSSGIAEGQVDQAKAQADFAKSQLDATVLRSPINGRISYRGVEAGELIGSSTLAFIVIDDASVMAEAGLSERAIGHIHQGQAIEVDVPVLGDAGSSRAFTGTVDSSSPAAEPPTMLYTVKVSVPNPEGKLRGGMLAKIHVPMETVHGAILVPEKALFAENGGDYAFVAESAATGSKASLQGLAYARRRMLVLGASNGIQAVVISGISPGEFVVTEGQDFISDGDPIKVSE
jgi:RND family efflux transporter MFP subunit